VGSAALYLKDPARSRFVGGGLPEAEYLFGTPLPLLPTPEVDNGRETFFVRFHPRLRLLLHRYIQGLLSQIGVEVPLAKAARAGADKDQFEYEEALVRVLKGVRASDRRLGLVNLFWLAHSRDAAEFIRELEARTPAVRKGKYSLHPLLSSLFRRVEQEGRQDSETTELGRAGLAGARAENSRLVDAIIEDGFAFTELTISDVDFNHFLASNKRYRLSVDVFFEIYSILLRETERRVREGDRLFLAQAARYLPDLAREQYGTPAGAVKVMMNAHVLTFLFADAWNTGTKLTASAKLKTELERRRPAEVMDAFVDLLAGVKRFEILAHIRDRITLMSGYGEEPARDDVQSTRRHYEFGESAQVRNNALQAAVLFLDLRGFTKTSESQISERDLTRELYTVFDAFVPLVRRFGGRVDKFLGDGILATYGTDQSNPADPLNALRTAILCQETLHEMRQDGRTYFKMGIAIHYGRVYLAHFIADEGAVHTTVIGRNVNLAGRLSSAAKRPLEEDEGPAAPEPPGGTGLHVSVEKGDLFNEGIAVSREMLVQLQDHLGLAQPVEGSVGRLEYFDDVIGRRIAIVYAGDAKFKGVRASFPVYAVEYER
jgi:class 3 adenylate cyclase